MKKTFAILAFISISILCSAQTYLKGNAAYWAVGITNVSIETRLSNKLTFNSDLVFSPWESIRNNAFLFGQIIPEVRFYPNEAFKGFYVGGYAAFQVFKMTKWNYWNTGKYQKGRGFALGLSIGYQIPISNRWNLDVYGGAGWQNSQYKGYYMNTDKMYVGWNGSGEWLPYKIGIAIAYRL